MNYPSWSPGDWLTAKADHSLKSLRGLGANAVTLVIPIHQDNFQSVDVFRDPLRTPSDAAILHAVNLARNLGMIVWIKPLLITGDDGSLVNDTVVWRGTIKPTNWAQWFESYTDIIRHYAELGNAVAVDALVVGSEMKSASPHAEAWQTLIMDAQRRYTGSLVYSANWDEFDTVTFWDALPYLGIDAYPPIGSGTNASVNQMAKRWNQWIETVRPWQAQWQKPLILGEVGFASVRNMAGTHSPYSAADHPDVATQRRAYDATINVIGTLPQLVGVFWWNWESDPSAGGIGDTGFTPKGKPAMNDLSRWFNQAANPR